MNTIEWIVILGGLTAIAWVNWYFFMAQAFAAKRVQRKAELRTSAPRRTINETLTS
ncbi:hypothetical protein [Candidatus Nitrospira neomarina]|uniref:Uncharacterized protein n=1 Tax=Candidatus Nitrospira neomarina TaxID=3020899 RepID=A0AA96GQK7_9BACT|nr:hypothetical protein [Candidatus Nitrospira neomarina]WNM63528.1 hypothetical protein PQG83_07175 [Candidatus Nitrospira neomarina]